MAGINNKKVWVNGDDTDAAWFNAAQNPTFTKNPATDNLINPDENWQLTNNSLSRASGNILPEWEAFRDALKVSPGTGLSVAYAGGAIKLPDGAIATIAPSTIAVPNNATSTVYVQENGTVAVSTDPPPMTIPLALVTTVAGTVTGVVDLRTPYQLFPRAETVKILGGFSTTDFVLSGNATFSLGEYLFRNFTIEATGVLTVDKFVTVYCTDAVINGSIIVTQSFKGIGGNTRTIYGSGGFATGIGIGASSGSSPGTTYNYRVSSSGSSGSEGAVEGVSYIFCTSSKGGDGGGAIIIEASRSITINGQITAIGGSGVIGDVLSSAVALSGGGGGSGGSIILKSKKITFASTATLSVLGGNGAPGISTHPTSGARGGGGGGGGVIVLIAPTITKNSANFILSGGSPGADNNPSSSPPPLGGAAGAGFGGIGGTGGNAPGGTGGVGLLLERTFLPVF